MSLLKALKAGQIDSTMHKKTLDYGDQIKRNLKDSEGDLITSLDALYFQNPEFVEVWNRQAITKGDTKSILDYSLVAKQILDDEETNEGEKATAQRYLDSGKKFGTIRAALDTASNPGGANVIPTILSDVLAYRVESAGQVLSTVQKVSVPDGNYEQTKYNKGMLGEFKTETGTFTDASTYYEDGTDGLNKVLYTTKDFGLMLQITSRQIEKMTPSLGRQIIDQVAKSLARGADSQILIGNGSGQNATGMIQNATSATAGANAFETFANAIGTLGDANIDPSSIVAYMNTATYAHFLKLRGTNQSYLELINGNFANPSIHGIKVVISNLIKTATGAATVVLGDPSHYIWATNGSIRQIEDKYSGSDSLQQRYVFYTFAEGKPIFNDSFAKFSVTL
jgi:HK97 family phage major capsid protein